MQKLPLNLDERSKIGNNDNRFLLLFRSGAAILYKAFLFKLIKEGEKIYIHN